MGNAVSPTSRTAGICLNEESVRVTGKLLKQKSIRVMEYGFTNLICHVARLAN